MNNIIISESDFGKKRKVQEDSHFSSKIADVTLPYEYMALVADGMGGHEAGDKASGLARDLLKELFFDGKYKSFAKKAEISEDPESLQFFKQVLRESIKFIHREIKKRAGGTTCTVALIFKPMENSSFRPVVIGHVGDSRAYKISKTKIEQLTDDDSLVWQLYKTGQITKDKMNTHKDRNVVTQALGGDAVEDVHIYTVKLLRNETLLLCSDGLHGLMNDRKIFTIYNSSRSLEELKTNLINAANNLGGKDNISVALFSENLSGKGGFGFSKTIISSLIVAFLAISLILLYYSLLDENGTTVKSEAAKTLGIDEPIDRGLNSSLEQKPIVKITFIDNTKIDFNIRLEIAQKLKKDQSFADFIVILNDGIARTEFKLSESKQFNFIIIDSTDEKITLIKRYQINGVDTRSFSVLVRNSESILSKEITEIFNNPFRDKIDDFIASVKLDKGAVIVKLKKGKSSDLECNGYNLRINFKGDIQVMNVNTSNTTELKFKLKKEQSWRTYEIKKN